MTPWKLILAPAAQRDFGSLPSGDASAVERSLDRLAHDPRSVDIRKLRGASGEWRMRVGRWRVRFTFDADRHVIEVLRILARPEAYRR